MTNLASAKDKIVLGTRLEVIDDPQPRPAAFNMAADESLLEHLGANAVLRVYRWARPAVSFGYFTAYAAAVRAAAVAPTPPRRELVRRWTGGGIVKHGADFTYALLIPRAHLARLGSPWQSYALIHGALAQALAEAGFQIATVAEEEPAPTDGANASNGECFEHPVAHDLMAAGRKAAGGAQRRTCQGLLHQGSVQGFDGNRWREELAGKFARALCAAPETREMSAVEEDTAMYLAESRYATAQWLERI